MSSKNIEFTLVYNRHKTGLYNYALRMTRDKMTAMVIIQSAFEKYYRNMERIDKPESTNYWLVTAVRNEVLLHFRKGKVRAAEDTEEIDAEEDVSLPDLLLESKELKETIDRAIAMLPEDLREVILLREFGGLSYEEMAITLSVDIKLIKSRLFNARKKLHRILSETVNEIKDLI